MSPQSLRQRAARSRTPHEHNEWLRDTLRLFSSAPTALRLVWQHSPDLGLFLAATLIAFGIEILTEHRFLAALWVFIVAALLFGLSFFRSVIGKHANAAVKTWTVLLCLLLMALFIFGEVAFVTMVESRADTKVTFKDSPLFTASRRRHITRVVNDYYDYLKQDVGLELQKAFPPLGLSPPGSILSCGGGEGSIPYFGSVLVQEDLVDNDDAIRLAFSICIFTIVRTHEGNGKIRMLEEQSNRVFYCYFPSSFSGKSVCDAMVPGDNWYLALWDIRKQFGQRYADQLTGLTIKMWPNAATSDSNFDDFFDGKLWAAETALNNSPERFKEIDRILKSKGIETRID